MVKNWSALVAYHIHVLIEVNALDPNLDSNLPGISIGTVEGIDMDNDILIDQARQLYASLLSKQVAPANNLERLDRLARCAYCRYVRRLNRCAICYQHRTYDCNRDSGGKSIPCSPRSISTLAISVELVI